MTDGRFLILWIFYEKRLFTQNVAAAHYITYSLLVCVLDSHHEGTVQDEVDCVDFSTLVEEAFTFLHLDDFGRIN